MTGVTLEKVNKNFGAVKVIKGVDLEIDDGEFTVFVGPSGCGKSTLLRLVAGLEDTSSGTIHIGKIDVTHVEPAERGVAMVFQSYALYPHMTVEDNMGFGLKMNGLSVEETNARVNRAAKILHLGDLLQRKPKQLSGGQRQRVAIGRAIVREPKVFLFDEPLSNLDAELRVQMRLEIAKLHQDLGATMIYVTHDQVEAMTLADKIVVLRAGYIEQIGSPLHLYRDPDNIFVAGFIGSPRMNFLDATVTAAKGETISILLDEYSGAKFDMKLSGDIPRVGTEVSVGVRPENFIDAGKVKLKTKIDVIENLGGTSYAYANSHNSEPLTIELSADHKAKEGSAYTAGFMGKSAFLFDRNTKLRLR